MIVFEEHEYFAATSLIPVTAIPNSALGTVV